MTIRKLSQFLVLPELKIVKIYRESKFALVIDTIKQSDFEVCPKCANISKSIYDHRTIDIVDAPIRNGQVLLRIKKRRFMCRTCKKPFTEPVSGIKKGCRTTQRLMRYACSACETSNSISEAAKNFPVSRSTIASHYHKQLSLEVRKVERRWPTRLGIDEHSFSRKANNPSSLEWVTMFVDHKAKRLFELTKGREISSLVEQTKHIIGADEVRNVTIDLSEGYRTFIKNTFRYAKITADKL